MPKEHAATSSLDQLTAEVARLSALLVEQSAVIKQQAERIAGLEARLAKDSHNSSKPPSSDPPFRKPPPRSQRKVSGCKPGGQKGHMGEKGPGSIRGTGVLQPSIFLLPNTQIRSQNHA